MLTNLMQEQQKRLVQKIQDRPHFVDTKVVSTLALIDILDVLQEIEKRIPDDMGLTAADIDWRSITVK